MFLENVQFNAQIFLGILPDRFDQALSLLQHMVDVVVDSVILEEFSRRALAGIEVAGQ